MELKSLNWSRQWTRKLGDIASIHWIRDVMNSLALEIQDLENIHFVLQFASEAEGKLRQTERRDCDSRFVDACLRLS